MTLSFSPKVCFRFLYQSSLPPIHNFAFRFQREDTRIPIRYILTVMSYNILIGSGNQDVFQVILLPSQTARKASTHDTNLTLITASRAGSSDQITVEANPVIIPAMIP